MATLKKMPDLPIVRAKTSRATLLKAWSIRLLPVVGFLLLWEIVSRSEVVNPRLFPPPTRVWRALCEWYASNEFWRDVTASCARMLIGFITGGVVGVVLGMLTGRNRAAEVTLTPLVQILRPLPPVAIIPLVIVWLGIGNTAKIFSIAFAVFFPVWINTHLGAARIPSTYIWSASLLSKSRIRTIFRILVPAALPSIIPGLRTAISIAFIMVYVSEIAGASSGIGYQISVCHLAYRIDRMMAALGVLAAAGALSDGLFAVTVWLAFPWTREQRKR